MSVEFEQKKRNVINALNSVLRTGALKDQDIGQQRLVLLVDHLLEEGDAQTLPLGPVYEYLKDKQLEEDAILETLLVFKERESTIGLTLALPAPVEQLPRERKQRLLLRYQKRQLAPRTRAPGAPQSPAPTAPAPKAARSGSRISTTQVLFGVLLAVLVLGGGTLVWQKQSSEPPAVVVVIDDPMALPCKPLKGNKGILMCWLETAAFQKLGPSERKTRSLATKAAGAGLGYKTLQVWTLEDLRLREVH